MSRPSTLQDVLQALPARAARPTKRVSPRAALACKRPRIVLALTSSHTSTGSASPLTGNGPRALTWISPSASRRVAAVEPDTPRRRELFHTRRQMRGLAHRPGRPYAGRCRSPAPRLPPSKPHPLPVSPGRGGDQHLLGIAAHGRLHGQSGVTGPLRRDPRGRPGRRRAP